MDYASVLIEHVPDQLLFILAMHSIAAVLTLVFAIRDGLESSMRLRWTVMGFVTGPIGVVSRARLETSQVGYFQILQDTVLSLSLEGFALYVLPRFLG
jgi:hypothetical protein